METAGDLDCVHSTLNKRETEKKGENEANIKAWAIIYQLPWVGIYLSLSAHVQPRFLVRIPSDLKVSDTRTRERAS